MWYTLVQILWKISLLIGELALLTDIGETDAIMSNAVPIRCDRFAAFLLRLLYFRLSCTRSSAATARDGETKQTSSQ